MSGPDADWTSMFALAARGVSALEIANWQRSAWKNDREAAAARPVPIMPPSRQPKPKRQPVTMAQLLDFKQRTAGGA